MRVAGFEDGDEWPRRWAEQYVARARDEVGDWLKSHGVRFFPVVNWAERGRVRRRQLGAALPSRVGLRPGAGRLGLGRDPAPSRPRAARGAVPHARHRAGHREGAPSPGAGSSPRTRGRRARPRRRAKQVVVAAGGIGGNLEIVPQGVARGARQAARTTILMGSHYYADGAMHKEVGADRRQRHPHLADVELRRRRPPPEATPAAARAEADPAALRARARPDRHALRADPADADVRRLTTRSSGCARTSGATTGWSATGRSRAASSTYRAREHNPNIREKRAGPVPALGPARQADARPLLRRALPGFRHRRQPSGAGAEDGRGDGRRSARPGADAVARSSTTTRRSRAGRGCSTTISCAGSSRCATGAETGCGRAGSSGSSTRRRGR